MRLFVGIIFILSVSCTSLSRKVATVSPTFIHHKTCPKIYGLRGECYSLDAKVTVSSRSTKLKTFNFPLPRLDSPFYEDVPYYIKINSDQIKCEYSSSITKMSQGQFRVKLKTDNENLNCSLESQKTQMEFSYIIPVFTPFPVKEAEWMRGFFPDIVSQTELKLSQIYDKWFEAKRSLGDQFQVLDGITYRGRELLLKYFDDITYNVISPRKYDFQFERVLVHGDLLVVKDVKGYIFHPKLGRADHGGYSTEDYLADGSAGKRFLEKTRIKPFEFFCIQNGKVFDFRIKNKIVFDSPGTVSCGVNSKKNFFLPLIKPKGQVEFYVQHMNVKKSIKLVPSHIENASTKIKNQIEKMNESNKSSFKSWIYRGISKKETEVQSELQIDSMFSPVVELNGQLWVRGKLEVCGILRKSPDLADTRALVEINTARAHYGDTSVEISLPHSSTVKSQLTFEQGKFLCFPIDAESLLKESYLRAVLFYEP